MKNEVHLNFKYILLYCKTLLCFRYGNSKPNLNSALHTTIIQSNNKTIRGLFHFKNNSGQLFHTQTHTSLSFSFFLYFSLFFSLSLSHTPLTSATLSGHRVDFNWDWPNSFGVGLLANYQMEMAIILEMKKKKICFPYFLSSFLCMSIFGCFRKNHLKGLWTVFINHL